MSSDIKPTQDDLARDLRADLAVVEKAAPGPWNSAARIDGAPDDAAVFIPERPGWGGPSILVVSPYSGLPRFRRNEDARAIGLMRVAWPAAIRRALAAEAEVLRLRGEVDALEGVVRDESARADEVVRSLTDEVRRLRAAVGLAAGLAEEVWHRVRDSAPASAMAYCEHVVALARLAVGRAPDADLAGAERALLVEVRRAVRAADEEAVRDGVEVTDDDGEAD